MNKLNKLLLSTLAIQLALAALLWLSKGPAPLIKPTAVLTGFDASKVTKLVITGNGADKTKKPVELTKRGDAWVMASHFDYPVATSKVQDLLTKLGSMKSTGVVASKAERHKQLGVADDEFERKLTLTASSDTTLIVGRSAGGRANAVRLAGKPDVLGVAGIDPWSIAFEPSGWMETAYTNVADAELERVTVEHKGKTLDVRRINDKFVPYQGEVAMAVPAGKEIDPYTVDGIAQGAGHINASEPADAKRVITSPDAVITLWQKAPAPADKNATPAPAPAPRVIDVVVAETETVPGTDGKPGETKPKKYWVKDRAGSTAVLVEAYALDRMLNVSEDKLFRTPPPPPDPNKKPIPGLPDNLPFAPPTSLPPGFE